MIDIKPSAVVIDSQNNKFFFYYKDSSIYCREATNTGEIKDTILVNQVNSDFSVAADMDDNLYLVCNSRYKGIMLFVCTDFGWKFEYVVNTYSSSNIYIMDMFIINGSIHLFFSKKLPLPHSYNIYHISKSLSSQAPYVEPVWKRNSLSEIYSQNLEQSCSVVPGKDYSIHFAGVWHDGANHYINYCFYDDNKKSWLHNSLPMAYKSNVRLFLLYFNEKLSLFCFYNDSNGNNFHHFVNRSTDSSDMDFKHLYSTRIDNLDVISSFYVDKEGIFTEWIKDRIYHCYLFNEASEEWKKEIELPIASDLDLFYLKKIKNDGNSQQSIKGYYILDKNYELIKPLEYISYSTTEIKSTEKLQNSISIDTDEYLKEILEEIRSLSDSMKHLNSRIDNLEGKFVEAESKADKKVSPYMSKKQLPSTNTPLKKSGFKEKFMNSNNSPTFQSLLMNQESISTFKSVPYSNGCKGSDKANMNRAYVDEKTSENRAYVEPASNNKKPPITGDTPIYKSDYKNSSILKKIGEFFK
jgi:hypothetical protein